jgi:2'-5' RNA ligase
MSKEDIRNKVRKLLLEKEGDTYDYGCVMLYFNIDKSSWGNIQDLIDEEDIYTEDGDQTFGRETEPHVTILYGLHASIPDSDIKELIDNIKPSKLVLKEISIFENDKFDVVKFDVTGVSKGRVSKLNKKFTELPHTTDYPDYHPHTTIAYVKSGMGKKYVQTLSGESTMIVSYDTITYSKADNTKNKYKLK